MSSAHVCGAECQLPSGRCLEEFVREHPLGATLAKIGAELGLCSERVRQIEVSALRKLRAGLDGDDAAEGERAA